MSLYISCAYTVSISMGIKTARAIDLNLKPYYLVSVLFCLNFEVKLCSSFSYDEMGFKSPKLFWIREGLNRVQIFNPCEENVNKYKVVVWRRLIRSQKQRKK